MFLKKTFKKRIRQWKLYQQNSWLQKKLFTKKCKNFGQISRLAASVVAWRRFLRGVEHHVLGVFQEHAAGGAVLEQAGFFASAGVRPRALLVAMATMLAPPPQRRVLPDAAVRRHVLLVDERLWRHSSGLVVGEGGGVVFVVLGIPLLLSYWK